MGENRNRSHRVAQVQLQRGRQQLRRDRRDRRERGRPRLEEPVRGRAELQPRRVAGLHGGRRKAIRPDVIR